MRVRDKNYIDVFHNHLEISPEENQDISRIQALWKAVIMQAFTDAVSGSKKKYMKLVKFRALSWLKAEDDEDLITVCNFANLPIAVVKEKVYAITAKGRKNT